MCKFAPSGTRRWPCFGDGRTNRRRKASGNRSRSAWDNEFSDTHPSSGRRPRRCALIREQLRRAGLDVVITVVTGREAFRSGHCKSEFDLVLSDYRVPRFNGLDALESLRRVTQSVPFILVTGALGDEGAIELLRSGATDCVLKDRLARLAPAIQRALSSTTRNGSTLRFKPSCWRRIA
jgi:CheY-like chemotaxis protein